MFMNMAPIILLTGMSAESRITLLSHRQSPLEVVWIHLLIN